MNTEYIYSRKCVFNIEVISKYHTVTIITTVYSQIDPLRNVITVLFETGGSDPSLWSVFSHH